MSARSGEDAGTGGDSPALVVRERGLTVIWLRGEHDLATVAALDDTLAAALAADDAHLVVDMRRVSFIDAASIGALVRSREALARESRRLTIRSPSPCVQHVLAVCGLTHLVEADGDSGPLG